MRLRPWMCFALALAACAPKKTTTSSPAAALAPTASQPAASAPNSPVSATGARVPAPDATLSPHTCTADGMTTRFGKHRLLVGAQMEDGTAAAAPWDLRYLYLAGGLNDGVAPCQSCDSCTASGNSCANSGPGCMWWGCWQDSTLPPAQYLRTFLGKAKELGQRPLISYYQFLNASGRSEGANEVGALNDAALMSRYFADLRFALTTIGAQPAMFHMEPDLWGYAQLQNANPAAIPVAVTTANSTDCAAESNDFKGFGKCVVKMVRKYAPQTLVGYQASAWATTADLLLNRDASVDIEAAANATADFLLATGGAEADFVVLETSDRDAAWYSSQGKDHWWDASNATLPNFHQAFRFGKAITARTGKPALYWQTPVGNMQLGNIVGAWQDNRVDYFFDHPAELVAAGAFGAVFGSGGTGQTSPSTDSGHVLGRAKDYFASGGTPSCP